MEQKEWHAEKEAKKWRNLAILITMAGALVFVLPWETTSMRMYVAIPLYMMFVYVYYKYICLRKAAQEERRGEKDGSAVVEASGKGKKSKVG